MIRFSALVLTLVALTFSTGTTVAHADSYWNHNGSIMRLETIGNERYFYYHQPRAVLRKAGVRPGTLLFNGRRSGNTYSGVSRVFSQYCVGAPLEYSVDGDVVSTTKVVLYGSRPKHRRCQDTGQIVHDTLVFTYMYSD